ncbi:zinc-binding dehydrogenase [Bacteroides sp. 519]|uniref:zinc-dependent alcohol dehydrogenase n=1 Tax=Bacteroides sp. 519 TaxID=2302937 RepID=UPI0013D858A4|nr:zinc-binding dehydrogenase [Bacteroides sp. 519]NDV57314.1 sorbitol dehydrogenase [Bacteroides sp. 519]
MKSVIVTKPGTIEIKEVKTPVLSPYQALVKTEMMAFCNATDRKLITGTFPKQENYPIALGHENVGIVVEIGNKVKNFAVGDRVIGGLISSFQEEGLHSAWGGFSEYVVVNDFDVLKEEGLATPEQGCWDSFEIQNRVPQDIQPEEAVIACTWREILGAFNDFHLMPSKKVLVFGSGPVGLSFVKLGKLFGLGQIDIVDQNPEKLVIAKKMGADNTYTSKEVECEEFIRQTNRSYDTVIDAVGLESIVNTGLSLLKMAGDICVYGVMTKSPQLDLTKAPYNFNLYMHQWPTRSEERTAMATLSKWVREGKLSASDFISHRFRINEIHEAFEAIKRNEVIKAILTF